MVPFRACIGADVVVDGERHICSALLLLAGVSCCMYSVLRAAATLCSACLVFLARASREEKEVDEGKPSHAWRG